MVKVNNRCRIWNDLRTDCEILLPGREIDGELLDRAIAQGFDPDTGEIPDGPVPEEKASKPKSNKALKGPIENKSED